jgi:hypothetical protein
MSAAVGVCPSRIDSTVVKHSCTEHRDNSSAAEMIVHKDSLHISNHNISNQIYAIDSVSDTLGNGNNYITVRDIREAEITANDQFADKEYESMERNHICSIIPSSHNECILFEMRQLHMNNNYKVEEFKNNNDTDINVVDNRSSFQTQNSVSFPLEHHSGKVTVIAHTDEVDLNKAGNGIPVNNNDLGAKLDDVGTLYEASRAPFVALRSDGDDEKFEYSVTVKGQSYKSLSSGEFGNREVEGSGGSGGIDDIGTDSTNLVSGGEIHFDSTSTIATSSCSDLNIYINEPGTNKDTEMSCGQIEHTDSHFRVTSLPTWHSRNQNVPETEGIIHNGRQMDGIYAVDNHSCLNQDEGIEQFFITGCHHIVSCNTESCTSETKDVQGTEILQLDQETGKLCVKTVTVLKQSTVHVKSPIVDSLEHSSYGSTSEIKTASLDGGKFCRNGNDVKLTKPAKHKKKEPGIT